MNICPSCLWEIVSWVEYYQFICDVDTYDDEDVHTDIMTYLIFFRWRQQSQFAIDALPDTGHTTGLGGISSVSGIYWDLRSHGHNSVYMKHCSSKLFHFDIVFMHASDYKKIQHKLQLNLSFKKKMINRMQLDSPPRFNQMQWMKWTRRWKRHKDKDDEWSDLRRACNCRSSCSGNLTHPTSFALTT